LWDDISNHDVAAAGQALPGAPRFQTFSDRGGLLLSRVHVLRGRFFEYHGAFVAVAANVTDEPLEELRQREPENISNLL
jgi:hypothetical protein